MAFPNNPTSPPVLELNSHAINTSCVGFWPLTQVSGTTATDISTGGNDGTESGGVTWASTDLGNAASLDGIDDYFTHASNLSTLSTAYTVCGWFRRDAGSSGTIASHRTTTPILYQLDTNGTVPRMIVRDDSGNISSVSATTSIINGDWYFVCGVRDGNNVYVYVNGVQESSGSATFGAITITETPEIGALYDGNATGQFMDGNIQNVRIFNTALSASDVALLYSRPWVGTDYDETFPYSPPVPSSMSLSTDTTGTSLNSGCVAWWPLTDGSGSSPADVSGNSETLTNGGSSEWGVQSVGNVAVTNNNTGAYYSTDSAFSTMIGGSTPATDPWTISFWSSMYVTAPYYYEDGVFSIGSSANDGSPFLLVQRSGSLLKVLWGGTYVDISGVSNRTWANVTITFDGTTMNCYVDGSLGGTRTSAGVNGNISDKFWIGTGYNNNNTAPDDYLQNVRIWNRALTADEITLLYERPWEGEATYGDLDPYDPPPTLALKAGEAINTDCVGWWPLLETDDYASGAADISGNANTLTKAGTVTSEPAILGTVGEFDGSTGHLRGSQSFSNNWAGATSITVSAWARIDNDTSDQRIVFAWDSINSNNGSFWGLWYDIGDGAKGWAAAIKQDNGANVVAGLTIDSGRVGEWAHIAFSWSTSDQLLRLFVNGVLIESLSCTNMKNATSLNSQFDIGRISNVSTSDGFMDGDISNVRIWSRALSAVEVQSLYETPWIGSNYPTVAEIFNYIYRSKRFRRL